MSQMNRTKTVSSTRILLVLTLGALSSVHAQDEQVIGQAVERLLAGEEESKGSVACDVLGGGVLRQVFGNGAEAASYRPGSKYVPQALCTATWDKPDAEALQQAFAQFEMDRMMAKMRKQPFDKPAPPPPNYSVSLTILDERYDSPEDAVASLEASVASLSEGVTVTVQGKEHTTKVEFGDWVDEVGDRAIWAPKLGELQVASQGIRFAIGVSGYEEASRNLDQARAVAQHIASSR